MTGWTSCLLQMNVPWQMRIDVNMSPLLRIQGVVARVGMLLRRVLPGKRQAKTHRARFYRDAWETAAAELGATVETADGSLLVLRREQHRVSVCDNYTDLDGPATLRFAGNKRLVHERLRSCGLRTPEYQVYSLDRLNDAYTFLTQHGRCVVKPVADTGAGAGVTTNITSRSALIAPAINSVSTNAG